MTRRLTFLAAALCLAALAACNFSPAPRDATPTVAVEVTKTETPAPTPEPTISLTPSRTLPAVPQLVSPTPTATQGPPTATFTPSETPGPYQHTIKAGETLGYIIQLYGYTDFGVIDQVVRMNPNIPDADHLPGEGAVILIPRQTITPTPAGFELTVTAGGFPTEAPLPGNGQITQVTVLEGQTIIGIAGEYNTTLEILDRLNPEIRFSGCDFSNPSGGPDCNVQLSVGQSVNVPQPTPTTTLSPTPSGSETPTPTPTFIAPMLVFPPQGAKAPPRTIVLQWISIGELPASTYYLVQVQDLTINKDYLLVTRDTSINLTDDMVPTDGKLHDMQWRILVGVQTDSGAFKPFSTDAAWRTFQWQSK